MKLFEPGKIGAMEVKNRIVMAAMGVGAMAEADGAWGERMREYYIARARGGTGLITTAAVFASQKLELPNRLDIYSDGHLESMHKVVETLHRYGAKVSVQLTAGFGRVVWQQYGITTPISASAVPYFWNPTVITRAITLAEAEELAQAFGGAAKRCRMAGVDAVELNGHEGYILDQFMTGLWNQRSDKYGGSKEKRLTFVREAIAAIKNEVGEALPVIYRFGIDHYFEGGRTTEESLWIARQLQAMGVNAFHVDAGCYETSWWSHPPTYQPSGCLVDVAEKVKGVVEAPVIAVGKLQYPALAEKVLQEGKADFIAIGRGLLADPDWPNKVMEGRFEDITPCIGDHEGCSSELHWKRAASCTLNPACGHEKEWGLTPIKRKKAVLVVGGGPAGMEAARVAAIRGLNVTLWEKTDRLGGNLWPASVPEFKKDLRDLINYQTNQLNKLPVEIKLNHEAKAQDIIDLGAACVIIATGARQENLKYPGADSDSVVTTVDLLLNRRQLGKRVIIVGGGFIGCETAVYLAQKDHQVTLTSRRVQMLTDMNFHNRQMLFRMMADNNVQILTDAWPVEIIAGGMLVKRNGEDRSLSAESFVVSGGMTSCNELQKTLDGKITELYAIGDCVEPRLVINAIWEAFHTARKIEA